MLAGAALALCLPAIAHADKIDDAKYLLKDATATQALQAITTPTKNYIWARDTLAGTPSPTPSPTPTPTPTPSPTPTPTPTPGIPIANNAALQTALTNAKGGEAFDLAAGAYSINLSNKAYSAVVKVRGKGDGKVTFSKWLKLSNVKNFMLDSVDIVQTGQTASDVLVSPTNVDGLTLRNINFIGQPGGYGYAFWAKAAGVKNVKIDGGTCSQLEYCFAAIGIDGLEVSNVQAQLITADFVQLGGGAKNVNVHHNKLFNWKPARGSHPDAFQNVCYTLNVTFSFNDVRGALQGANQFGNAAACPDKGSDNFIVEGNTFQIDYANNAMLVNSTGKITNNTLLTGANGYAPLIRVNGGSVQVSGNTRDGKPYP